MLMFSRRMKLLKYIVRNKFRDFLPDPGDFELIQENVPKLKPGEFLVKAEYISTDPYLRSFANKRMVPYEQFGFQVGKVIDSKNPEYPTNMHVVSHAGWRNYTILNGDPDEIFGMKPYSPRIGNLPLSLAVGALGMPGMTAYLGFLEVCKPKEGDVVCITSAAGTVGSLVGQMAKLMGCTVIGFAGTNEKVFILLEELKFDYAFNYKTVKDIEATIFSVCNGIDCYFDNVGGLLAAGIMRCMKENGRVAACGSISTYGGVYTYNDFPLVDTVKVEPFNFTQWDWKNQDAAIQHLRLLIEKGSVKVRENVSEGFETLPETFIGMLRGDNIGKTIVKV